jgi:hypothetical protein
MEEFFTRSCAGKTKEESAKFYLDLDSCPASERILPLISPLGGAFLVPLSDAG